MHIFIAGASGTVGHSLIPYLIAHGHTVTGTTRNAAKADALRALGAEPASGRARPRRRASPPSRPPGPTPSSTR